MDKQKGEVRISKRTLIIIIMIVLLLIAGGVYVGLNWNHWFDNASEEKFTPNIDEDASDWSDQQTTDNEKQGIKIPGYPSMTIEANKKNVSVALMNPDGNPCYFIFELSLDDTGEVLYTSDMIPPGQAIYEMTLSHGLSAGTYQAKLIIYTISLEDGKAMNGANMETILIVN